MRTFLPIVSLTLLVATVVLLVVVPGSYEIEAQNTPAFEAEPFEGWAERIGETHLDFTHYWDLDEVYATTRILAERFPELCDVEVIGTTYEGREILALTLTDKRSGSHDTKPGMYIDSNIHGTETQGTEIIMLTIWTLLKNFERVDYYTHLIKTRSFYFVPVVNADARQAWFNKAGTPGNLRRNFKPYDSDRDGLYDEDPLNDLDGDGRILMMRKKDPNGDWVLARDKRVMVRREPGQPGEYTLLGTEGIDDDGDGRINEDPVGGVDMNRNFPTAWLPEYQQRGSGDFPGSESEVQACIEFILARPNIAGFQFYHNTGRMILRSPGSSPDRGVISAGDVRVYNLLGERGKEYLPNYRYMQTHDELYKANGTQLDFGFLGLGRFTFTNELWGRTGVDMDGDGRFSREEVQRWYDNFGKGEGYIHWKPFTHPTLGEIELGGWDQFASRMSPSDMFMDEGYRNALFTLFHAESIAELEFTDVKATRLDGGLTKLHFALRNKRFMPTDSDKALQIGTATDVRVSVSGASIVSAGTTDRYGERVNLQSGSHDALRIRRVGSEGEQWCELIVKPKGGAMTLQATHPRSVDATYEMK